MQTQTEQTIMTFYREALARRRLMVSAFVVITLAMMAVGFTWPKTYSSSSTVLLEEQNIMEPLMRGAAVSSDMSDRLHNARELLFSRSIMMRVLEETGRLEDDLTPVEVEYMLEGLRGNTTVTLVGRNLVRVEYSGEDPELVYQTAEKLAGLFINEMTASKSAQTNAAYEFIDAQVRQYENELERAESELQALREKNPDARAGADREVTSRISTLRSRIDDLEQRLREAQITEASLEEQLSGEAEIASGSSRADRYRERLAELESQLDTLRLTYHDTYPDVVQLKRQIADVHEALEQEQASAQGGRPDASLRSNPVYQDLRTQLYETRTTMRTLRSSIADAQEKLEAAEARATRLQEVEAQLAHLTRDYEVNQGIYEDLQRRRENARVSMSMNSSQQGLNIRIYEPAYFSHQPSGPRMTHFVLGGFALGAAVPLGLLFGFLLIDPRVRNTHELSERLDLRVLGVVPHMRDEREARKERRGLIWSGLVVLATVAGVIIFLLLRG